MSTDPSANPNPSAVTSALDTLVGADKKFATPEDLARGKLEADTFIEKLKQEARDLRNLVVTQDQRLVKLEARSSILDRLEPNPNGGNPPIVTTQQPEPPASTGLTKDDVFELIEQRDVKRTATQNKSEVDAVLNKQFGDQAVAAVRQRANELGMTQSELAGLALRSPKAFYSMLGIDPNATQTGTLYTGTGRPAPANTQGEIRNNAYYNAIKAKVGTKAFIMDRRLQTELHKDMNALGDAFFA